MLSGSLSMWRNDGRHYRGLDFPSSSAASLAAVHIHFSMVVRELDNVQLLVSHR